MAGGEDILDAFSERENRFATNLRLAQHAFRKGRPANSGEQLSSEQCSNLGRPTFINNRSYDGKPRLRGVRPISVRSGFARQRCQGSRSYPTLPRKRLRLLSFENAGLRTAVRWPATGSGALSGVILPVRLPCGFSIATMIMLKDALRAGFPQTCR